MARAKSRCVGELRAVQRGAMGLEMVCWVGVLCPTLLLPWGTPRMLLGPDPTQELLGWIRAWGQCETVGLGASCSWDWHRAPPVLDGPTRLAEEGGTSVLALWHAGRCVQEQYYSSGPTALKNHDDFISSFPVQLLLQL